MDRLVHSEANARRIAIVEQCFGAGGSSLMAPGRVLVGEGVLTKMCRKKVKPRQFFLFNDILVYGNIVMDKRRYSKQHILALEDVKLQSLENEAIHKNGWQIISPKKSFAVFAATPTEKAEWMAHINKCIADLLTKSNKKPATEHAAVWVPDGDAHTCMHCLKTKFNAINRRHHCRKCGAVVCGTCSNKKFLLPYQSEKPLRVCISCFEALSAATEGGSLTADLLVDTSGGDYERQDQSLRDNDRISPTSSMPIMATQPQPRYGSSDEEDDQDDGVDASSLQHQPVFYGSTDNQVRENHP